MTDPHDDPTRPEPDRGVPDPASDRAEAALRDAFARRANAFEPRELLVPTRVRRRRPWLPAAAAVVLLAGLGVVVGVTTQGGGGQGSDSAGSAASSSVRGRSGADSLAAGSAEAQGAAPTSGPAAAPGMRWASRYDVEVQVPSSWVDAAPPTRPDCIRKPGDSWDDAPRTPYVASDVRFRSVPAIGCAPVRTAPAVFGDLPFALWQPSLSFTQGGPAADLVADGTWTYRGWTLMRWSVPGTSADHPVQVSLLTGPGQHALAQRIRSSARTFSIDANGCRATSPVQAADIVRPSAATSATRLTPTSVSVCQYARGGDGPGLLGSRLLTGSQMGALLRGIAEAPSGSGPNAPSHCDASVPGDTAIELRYHRGGEEPATAYVYYDACVGNGIYDADSTVRLTAADCRPLFARLPITLWSYDVVLRGVCRP
ncbi:hypothetical protein AB3X52_11895 [Nocardioides sp. DS6]|uniref:Uncharacterized protein n=1 Tax=Nocardioides eburneus TaxID=3231482 RepID=A0ABV3SZN7_9ACTN